MIADVVDDVHFYTTMMNVLSALLLVVSEMRKY